MRLTINAGCQLTFTGERYVHSWLRTDFAAAPPAVELTARCSNFGAYVLLLGSIPAADQFSATHAFLLRGRCLLRIALLVERLPSPGEFRDAVASLSPQQQAFAKAYRAMQLNATLFAVCVVQVKPQLERLLRLPPGALAKQLALTDDVIDLLTDWHFPPDLLSLDAAAPPLPAAAAVQTVRRNADRLLAIVAAEKQRLVDEQQRRRREESEALRLRQQEEEDRRRTEAMPLQPLVDDATLENLKAMFEDIGRLVQDQSCAIENIEANDDSTVLQESMHGRRGLFQLFRKLGSTPVAPTSEAVAAQVLHDLQSSRAQLVQTRSLIDEPALDGEQSSSFEDYTLLPSELDQRFVDESGAVRAMTIKPDDDKAWTLSRHPALTAEARTDTVDDEGKKQARNVAMDLLEAMTRSGELTASDATLHIVLGQSHAFADTLMHTLVRDNVNPIDCVERSSLLAAATVLRCRSQ